ncbi:hypothetical protein XELAEV_18013924mg [Xenopus laevis]|uniref:Uncharacterized protein n=1 Tax=Xenopus laevis TaxID=8355 RepID=A0A974DQG7_XENLA|nr:hypothetical protein XELAEV_18013924mg [Xenopus laevis]
MQCTQARALLISQVGRSITSLWQLNCSVAERLQIWLIHFMTQYPLMGGPDLCCPAEPQQQIDHFWVMLVFFICICRCCVLCKSELLLTPHWLKQIHLCK